MKFTIIIIGYNTSQDLKSCLLAINKQTAINAKIDVLYVDDGSKDDSVEVFNNFNLKFAKNCIVHHKNLGRNHARNSAIKAATGDWCLFINSNIILNNNVINNYLNQINKNKADIITGNIKYSCHDKVFEKYLNSSIRGLNNYKKKQFIPYYYLLFSNACIKTSILKKNFFNILFDGYGGSELELAYRLNKSSNILFIPDTVALRNNHPSLKTHIYRIQSFGEKYIDFLFDKILLNDLPSVYRIFKLFTNSLMIVFFPFIVFNRWFLFKIIPFVPKDSSFLLIKFILGLSMIIGIIKNTFIKKWQK